MKLELSVQQINAILQALQLQQQSLYALQNEVAQQAQAQVEVESREEEGA